MTTKFSLCITNNLVRNWRIESIGWRINTNGGKRRERTSSTYVCIVKLLGEFDKWKRRRHDMIGETHKWKSLSLTFDKQKCQSNLFIQAMALIWFWKNVVDNFIVISLNSRLNWHGDQFLSFSFSFVSIFIYFFFFWNEHAFGLVIYFAALQYLLNQQSKAVRIDIRGVAGSTILK